MNIRFIFGINCLLAFESPVVTPDMFRVRDKVVVLGVVHTVQRVYVMGAELTVELENEEAAIARRYIADMEDRRTLAQAAREHDEKEDHGTSHHGEGTG